MERYSKRSAGSEGKYFNTSVGTQLGVFKKRERVLKNQLTTGNFQTLAES
jgi:hypothetical protein